MHLLGLMDASPRAIRHLLDRADEFLAGSTPPTLEGKIVGTLLHESPGPESTAEARVSWALAAERVGARHLDGAPVASLAALGADLIVLRHPESGAPQVAARTSRVPIVNGGDGRHEDPVQGLVNLLAIRRIHRDLEGIRVAIVGDVKHRAEARSLLWGLLHCGARVTLVGPPALVPPLLGASGAELATDLDAVIARVDVVCPFPPTAAAAEQSRIPSPDEYRRRWGLDTRPSSWRPATDPAIGVAVRIAVLAALLGGELDALAA